MDKQTSTDFGALKFLFSVYEMFKGYPFCSGVAGGTYTLKQQVCLLKQLLCEIFPRSESKAEQTISGENLCHFLSPSCAIVVQECQLYTSVLTEENLFRWQSTLRTVGILCPAFSYLFQTCKLGYQPTVIGGA